MQFLCDSTVGKLSTLLRMAGIDTAYISEPGWREAAMRTLSEQRIILTRNSRYRGLKLAPELLILRADDPESQLLAVLRHFRIRLDRARYLTRCVECNQLLNSVDKEEIEDRLWDYVAATQDRFFYCGNCDKIFWHATHARAMTQRLESIRKQLENDTP